MGTGSYIGFQISQIFQLLKRAVRKDELSYKIIYSDSSDRGQKLPILLKTLVGAAGLEPATLCLEGRCSIRLSYAPTS
jgi:hypothetical protein